MVQGLKNLSYIKRLEKLCLYSLEKEVITKKSYGGMHNSEGNSEGRCYKAI